MNVCASVNIRDFEAGLQLNMLVFKWSGGFKVEDLF